MPVSSGPDREVDRRQADPLRCLDQLRSQADRVIRVQEEHGMVKLQDETEQSGQQWELPRTALDLA